MSTPQNTPTATPGTFPVTGAMKRAYSQIMSKDWENKWARLDREFTGEIAVSEMPQNTDDEGESDTETESDSESDRETEIESDLEVMETEEAKEQSCVECKDPAPILVPPASYFQGYGDFEGHIWIPGNISRWVKNDLYLDLTIPTEEEREVRERWDMYQCDYECSLNRFELGEAMNEISEDHLIIEIF